MREKNLSRAKVTLLDVHVFHVDEIYFFYNHVLLQHEFNNAHSYTFIFRAQSGSNPEVNHGSTRNEAIFDRRGYANLAPKGAAASWPPLIVETREVA